MDAHEWHCIGEHDDDGECVDPDNEHHIQCVGHFGVNGPCIPCGHPRCISHDGDGAVDLDMHDDFCLLAYCVGDHYRDEDSLEVLCRLGHAFWCRNIPPESGRQCDGPADEEQRCLWPSGQSDVGMALITDLADEQTTIWTGDIQFCAVDVVTDLIGDLETARDLMAGELAAVAAVQEKINNLIKGDSQ